MMRILCLQQIILWISDQAQEEMVEKLSQQELPRDIMACKDSLTGAYLSGRIKIPVPAERRKPAGWIKVRGARENNLKNIDVDIPLGVVTCVTGVSGSGKSSLVNEILYKHLAKSLNRARCIAGDHDGIDGIEADLIRSLILTSHQLDEHQGLIRLPIQVYLT